MASKFTSFAKRAVRDMSVIGVSGRVSIDCSRIETSATVQSEKDAADINVILRRFKDGGLIPNVRPGTPQSPWVFKTKEDVKKWAELGHFGNFSFPDFQEAAILVADAKTRFEQLPSRHREFFKNSVPDFVKFCSDPKNGAKMVELGLAIPRPVAAAKPGPKDGERGAGGGTPPAPGPGKGQEKPPAPAEGGA